MVTYDEDSAATSEKGMAGILSLFSVSFPSEKHDGNDQAGSKLNSSIGSYSRHLNVVAYPTSCYSAVMGN